MMLSRDGVKESPARKIFVVFNTAFLTLLCVMMLLPLLKVVAESLSAKSFVEAGTVLFWPKGFNLEAYKLVFKDPSILRAFNNSVFITVVGTTFNLVMTSMLAYPLSREEFKYRKVVLFMITFTMIFSAPLIPNYLLIKALKMDNTFFAVIVPGAISAFNFHVLRSFFLSIPGELVDAARIDGCTETRILFNIVMPYSKPALASLALFYGVGHWNALNGPLIFLRDAKLKTLQLKLYSMLMMNNMDVPDMVGAMFASESVKMTTLVVATIPILVVYPFLQKYFVKGANLGAIK